MKMTTQRDRFMEALATLSALADALYDEGSPPEVARIVITCGFLTGLLMAQEHPSLAAAVLAIASQDIPDAVNTARQLAERLA